MRCFDCIERGHDTVAVAVCMECGAALCSSHTTTVAHLPHRLAGMGRATSPAPTRRLLCRTCHRTHGAA
ncbi:DUF2180 family protein [Streptomyces pinistramenti]|uniref:DUF2180 family protein n=1 Tax=Streptomyces pinistramenti TaxID=2884812 RepID=UPI001D06CD42|nr:DUF2180 family protein [Streptomyces pinistramenti]MCB5906402.1 DUF2180 family protein [Streptomyces pinistramenti]